MYKKVFYTFDEWRVERGVEGMANRLTVCPSVFTFLLSYFHLTSYTDALAHLNGRHRVDFKSIFSKKKK